jgi:pimeloyl-ACP methyl ester carboxylesterase
MSAQLEDVDVSPPSPTAGAPDLDREHLHELHRIEAMRLIDGEAAFVLGYPGVHAALTLKHSRSSGSRTTAGVGVFWPRSALQRTLKCLSGKSRQIPCAIQPGNLPIDGLKIAMDYDFRTAHDTFILPKPNVTLDLIMSDGATLCVRRHGNADGPRLVLSHGNGFAIDGYYPFWRLFLRDFEVILYDERNHGRNPPHHASGHTQAQMAQDMETVLRAVAQNFGERRTAGAFHSLSGIVSLQHFLRYGTRFDALVLFDPPLAPPEGHSLHQRARNDELALNAWARRRRSRFGHPSELAEHFKHAQSFRRWLPGAAELMARSITKPSPEGGCELVCPPAFEADVYLQNADAPTWQALPRIAGDILVVSCDYNAADADTPCKVCQAIAGEFGVKVVAVPDTGHLLQIERPLECANAMRDYLRARGFAIAT